MNIHDFPNKIKGGVGERKKTLIYIGILVFMTIAAFYLGYVARAETYKESLVAINCPANAYIDTTKSSVASTAPKTPISSTVPSGSGAYVASKNGTKYYPVACGGAKRIKDENKVFFQTVEQAVSAGYSLAVGC
jgi:hypothetical protein